jgi:hypothetical protein
MTTENTTTDKTTTKEEPKGSFWKELGCTAALGVVQGIAIYGGVKAAEWVVNKIVGGESE